MYSIPTLLMSPIYSMPVRHCHRTHCWAPHLWTRRLNWEKTYIATARSPQMNPFYIINMSRKKRKLCRICIEMKSWMPLSFKQHNLYLMFYWEEKKRLFYTRSSLIQQHIHHPTDLPPSSLIALIKYSSTRALIFFASGSFLFFFTMSSHYWKFLRWFAYKWLHL